MTDRRSACGRVLCSRNDGWSGDDEAGSVKLRAVFYDSLTDLYFWVFRINLRRERSNLVAERRRHQNLVRGHLSFSWHKTNPISWEGF
jgi:hypothetical protein